MDMLNDNPFSRRQIILQFVRALDYGRPVALTCFHGRYGGDEAWTLYLAMSPGPYLAVSGVKNKYH